MHDDAYIGGRSENNINALCMTISGGRTKQLDIFCHVTGFTSDFSVSQLWNLFGSFTEPFNYTYAEKDDNSFFHPNVLVQ